MELRVPQLPGAAQWQHFRANLQPNYKSPSALTVKQWFLLNASPDLRAQIEANQFLHPGGGVRNSPIAGVVLTSADLDQSLGLCCCANCSRCRFMRPLPFAEFCAKTTACFPCFIACRSRRSGTTLFRALHSNSTSTAEHVRGLRASR